jgi:hypothetical protein
MQQRFPECFLGAAIACVNEVNFNFFPMHKNQNRALGEIA